MKKTLALLALAAALPISLYAAPPNRVTGTVVHDAKLEKYFARAMTVCPGSALKIEQADQQGPAGFIVYRVTQTSAESNCGESTLAVVSPSSGQTFIGSVLPVPFDLRPVDKRLGEMAGQMLKKPVQASVSTKAYADGVRLVSLTIDTTEGPFSYHGYLDNSQRYLIVGRRGNLSVDPGKSLLEDIAASTGMSRGSKDGPIEIVEISDFQCPTCGRAHQPMEKFFEENKSKIHYIRLDLPIFEHHEWALYAALGARAVQKVAPEHYWEYVNYMFHNQEDITRANVDDMIKAFAGMVDIPWKKLESVYRSPAERKALMEQVAREYDSAIFATPTYIVNGRNVYYGHDGDYLHSYLNSLVGKKK